MKKTLAILLALAMALSLAACGGKDNPAPSGSQGGDAPLTREDGGDQSSTPAGGPQTPATDPAGGYDPSATLQEQMDSLNRNNLTPEQIAAIEADAKEGGYEVQWEADGSMSIKDGDATLTTSGDWPDNEFTKLIPAPKVGTIGAAQVSESDCTIIMTWTAEEAKEYAAQVKDAGFDQDVEEQDMAGMGVYAFSGFNADGVEVSVSFMSGTGGISIFNP